MNNSPDNRNLILAVILSALVFGGWYFFFGAPAMKAEQARAALAAKSEKHPTPAPATPAERPAWGPRMVRGAWWRSVTNLRFFEAMRLQLVEERSAA